MAGVGIRCLQAIGFIEVAGRAGEGELVTGGGAIEGGGVHVFEVEGCTLQGLVHAAVFATVAGAELHLPEEGGSFGASSENLECIGADKGDGFTEFREGFQFLAFVSGEGAGGIAVHQYLEAAVRGGG